MRNTRYRLLTASIAVLIAAVVAGPAMGVTVIMKDGNFIEGEIVLETSKSIRLKTVFSTRTYLRKDIEQIVETVSQEGSKNVNKFDELAEPIRAALNAAADAKLGNYQQVLDRLKPFADYKESPAVRIQMDWLIIDAHERLAEWETAKKLLEEKKASGTPNEKRRAKAHLDIFEWNPDYDLRYINKTHMRQFLPPRLQDRARERDSLADADIWWRAIQEYCEQLLWNERKSIKAFQDSLDPRRTYEACRKLPPAGEIDKHLPYIKELKQAEASILEAQAILPGYAEAYEQDLIRAEVGHLLDILFQMFDDALGRSPELLQIQLDPNTGRLTPAGREAWQAQCDAFLRECRPLMQVSEYMLDKLDRFPDGMRDMIEFIGTLKGRFEDMMKIVQKRRDRHDA
jgi:hypothetical protein